MSARILIVEDHPLVATSVELALRARGWDAEHACGPTLEAVVTQAEAMSPDCVLLDLHLGDLGTGVDLIVPLRALGATVVMLTAETDPLALAACLEAGAAGWVGKGAFLDDVVLAVADALAGRPIVPAAVRETLLQDLRDHRARLKGERSTFDRLTAREERVLGALVRGMTAEEIAAERFVSLATVRSQIRSILQKLQVHSQLAAVARANRVGWQPSLGDCPATPDQQRIAAAVGLSFHQS